METLVGILALLIIASLFLGLFALIVWPGYLLAGTVVAETNWTPREVGDSLVSYFVPAGWQLKERGPDFVILGRGPSGCSALLYLLIFFPMGLVYLFTDWGRARLTARIWAGDGAKTRLELIWRNAAIRREITQVLQGLAKD